MNFNIENFSQAGVSRKREVFSEILICLNQVILVVNLCTFFTLTFMKLKVHTICYIIIV